MENSLSSELIHRPTSSEKKRLKTVVEVLPYDCWSMIILFLGGFKEYQILLCSIHGLYDYVKTRNTYCTKNIIFRLVNYPKRGLILEQIRNVQIGDSKSGSVYDSNIYDRIRESSPANLIKRMITSFPKIESLFLNYRNFPRRSKTKYDIGKTMKTKSVSLKKLKLLFPHEITVNFYSDNFPSLESFHMEMKLSEKQREDFSYRSKYHELTFIVYGDEEEILPKLTEFSIIGFGDISMNPDLLPLIASNLRKLHLERAFPIYERIDSSIFKNLEDLKLINLLGYRRSVSVYVYNLPNLRNISISNEEHSGVETRVDFRNITNVEQIKLNCTTLTSLQLSHLKKVKKIDLNNNKIVIYQRSFLFTLEEFTARCDFSNSHFRMFPLSLKRMNLYLGNKKITINLNSIKSSLEYLSIEKKVEFWSPGTPDHSKNLDELIIPLKKKKRRLCDFKALKELRLMNYYVKEISLRDNLSLRKVIIRFRLNEYDMTKHKLSNEIIELKDLPNLEYLALDRYAECLIIQNCPSLKKLSLRECKSFPRNVDKSKLEELVIEGCGETILAETNRVIDGKIFKSLKYLMISQKWEIVQSHDFKGVSYNEFQRKHEAVKELRNLDKLWKLIIRSNFISTCGIDVIEEISKFVDVDLVYRKGIVHRDQIVVKSVDEKRLLEIFESFKKKNIEQ